MPINIFQHLIGRMARRQDVTPNPIMPFSSRDEVLREVPTGSSPSPNKRQRLRRNKRKISKVSRRRNRR